MLLPEPVARYSGMHDELVLVDQSQLRQRLRELHPAREQSLARLLLQLPDGGFQVAADELCVPIARSRVLGADEQGDGFPL